MLKIIIYFWMLFACRSVLSTNVTIKLALFCDLEFYDIFKHNETIIRAYWASRLIDADLRFKTLRSVDIKFVVTSLTIIKNKTDQPFIEKSRYSNGSVSIDYVLYEFTEWLLTYKGSEFNIALLGIGAVNTENHKTRGYKANGCTTSCYNHNFASAVVSLQREDLFNGCGCIEYALSTVLGAWDQNQYFCESQNNIMSKNCDPKYYFFSSCSDREIAKHIRTTLSCSHKIDTPVASVFNVSWLSVQLPSVADHCLITANSLNIWINQSDENRCFSTKCYLDSKPNRTFVKTIYPVDNSRCDVQKSCFRGRCIPNGFQLMNMASSKCLHSTDRFASNDSLEMVNCSEVPTSLDSFMLLDNGEQGIFLASPYSSFSGSENSDKCLAYTSFNNCYDTENKLIFGWDLISWENSLDEIFIRHKLSKLCLTTVEDHLQLFDCDFDDISFGWKLLKFHFKSEIPRHLFRSVSWLLDSENTTYVSGEKNNVSEEHINTIPTNETGRKASCKYLGVFIVSIGYVVLATAFI